MSRDIKQYTSDYLSADFENYMVHYRQKCELSALRKYPHRHILEIGCGMNPMFLHLDRFCNYTIVEPSSVFCKNAAALAAQNDLSDRVKIINEPFREDVALSRSINNTIEVDFVLCSSLLHEIEDPHGMLRAIRSICTPDTVVHFNVPNSRSFHLLLAYEAGLIQKLDELTDTAKRFQQNTTFHKEKLEQELKLAGFSVLECGSYFVKPFTHAQMKKLLENKIIQPDVLDGLDNMIKYMPDLGAELFANCKLAQ